MATYTLDNLLGELRQALQSGTPAAIAEVVRRAIREKPIVETGSTRLLHSEPGLTLLHTVVNPGFVSPPHDHRTWAVIGVYHGQENNNFYRLVGNNRRIEQTGGRELVEGEVLTLQPTRFTAFQTHARINSSHFTFTDRTSWKSSAAPGTPPAERSGRSNST